MIGMARFSASWMRTGVDGSFPADGVCQDADRGVRGSFLGGGRRQGVASASDHPRLGARRDQPEEGTIVVAFTAGDAFLNAAGVVHGGFLAAMLDDTMGPALVAGLEPGDFAPTTDLHVQFLRPARASRLVGRGRVVDAAGTSLSSLENSLMRRAPLLRWPLLRRRSGPSCSGARLTKSGLNPVQAHTDHGGLHHQCQRPEDPPTNTERRICRPVPAWRLYPLPYISADFADWSPIDLVTQRDQFLGRCVAWPCLRESADCVVNNVLRVIP